MLQQDQAAHLTVLSAFRSASPSLSAAQALPS
jgi:hypothetical protein